ncbi:MAG: DinB family protein [Acidobacteria bacterium]|nr:DinB family protein [Acidobacteriota bacterium]
MTLLLSLGPSAAGVHGQTSGSTASLAGDLSKDWAALKDTMMKLADAIPDDKFGYRPTPELRTFAEQLMHVAGANVNFMKLLDPKAAAPTLPQKPTPKAEAMKALGDSFDFGATVLKGETDATLQETVQGPRFLGPSTRARIVYRTMGHTWDEYGVMTVYLRLNGIVPPASRGSM